MNENQNKRGRDENKDPITGEPGSHPVGTGVGAVAGGAAGAAAGAATGAAVGTAGAGPIGTAVGAAAGAIIGGMAGHEVAEGMDPTSSPHEGKYIDYTVVDKNRDKVGSVESVWLDHNSQPAYLSVRTGWLGMGRAYVVPTQSADVSERRREIRLPYTLDQIKNAPEFDSSAQLQTEDQDRIGTYYSGYGFQRENWLNQPSPTAAYTGTTERTGITGTTERADMDVTADRPSMATDRNAMSEEERRIQLREEHVTIGKREVESGGVRLRKVVRTETVNQPVELRREEIVVERVPASEATATTGDVRFEEEEIYVPLRREEPVIAKETRVTGEVRVGKREEREERTISETVRKEDVEVVDEGTSDSRIDSETGRPRTGRYQPKERSRE